MHGRFGCAHPVLGYLGLGLLNEAADELELIEGKHRLSTRVLLVRCALYMAVKQ